MSTTSLKLSDDVKQLALAAARQQGVSPHAFMVDPLRSAAVAAEKRASFVADALAAQAKTLESGQGYAADAVHTYARTRARGEPTTRPEAESWRM